MPLLELFGVGRLFSFSCASTSFPYFSSTFSRQPRSVPDEEDADNSQVEDPEKCSQEEVKEIVEKVGEALEENFAHLEQLKAEKAEKEKPATNGDAEPTNGTNGDVEMAEEKKAGNLAWPFKPRFLCCCCYPCASFIGVTPISLPLLIWILRNRDAVLHCYLIYGLPS